MRQRLGRLIALFFLLTATLVIAVEQEHVHSLSTESGSELTFVSVEEGAAATKITVDISGKAADPRKKSGYIWIPNFVLKHMAQELTVKGPADCEAECNKHKSCKSYSYRDKDKLCLWSIASLHYRYDWDFYTKVHEMNAFGDMVHSGKYRKFPGVMYQEPGYKRYKNKSVKQCEKLCTKGKKCKAFSYRASTKRCMLSDAGVHYDPAFQYYEKRNAHEGQVDMEEQQKILQTQEVAAKKGKKERILADMRERKRKSVTSAREMRSKKVIRETALKKASKQLAAKRLKREKAKEAHDKRMARMKAAYNEGYFKAKGVVAEKKIKEKSIKALRAKEMHDKHARVKAVEKKKKAKIAKEKAKKKHERATKQDLLATKEKLVKLKNNEIKTEIAKEEKVLDVARNLALSKVEIHDEVVQQDKKKKRRAAELEAKKVKEMKSKTKIALRAKKNESKKFEKLKDKPLKTVPKGKQKGKTNRKKGKRKGKGKH